MQTELEVCYAEDAGKAENRGKRGSGGGEAFGECLEGLRVLAWENSGRTMMTCRQFNDFCARRGIQAGAFRRWLYQAGHIKASTYRGRTNYSVAVWVPGSGLQRCIIFR